MSRRYTGHRHAGTREGAAARTGRCRAGTKTGDLVVVLGLHGGEGSACHVTPLPRTLELRRRPGKLACASVTGVVCLTYK
ncbi:MAG: hypothetical protein KGZ50_03310 [Peptococcaceae bacterium]|nr:hypothetical protein [Peptococcaceae bacterium]